MILRIWYLGDPPNNYIGNPYLHREVEDWIARLSPLHVPHDKLEAPDLGVTDARGVTTFVAAFGLNTLGVADVQGMGLLGGYPGRMAFVGISQRLIIANMPDHIHTETITNPITGQRTVRPIDNDAISVGWQSRTELRLRGLVVDKERLEDTIVYVESRCKMNGEKVKDIML